MKPRPLYGLVAEFSEPEALLEAAARAREEGFRRLDAFTPYPVEDLAETLGMRWTFIPFITLVCGIGGGAFGYWLQWFSATIHYPLNVGGRPLHSWPAFVPVTFELTILSAALASALAMLLLNGLPSPYHPIFNTPHFRERNASRFYLCLEARDRRFELERTRAFLWSLTPDHVWEVPS